MLPKVPLRAFLCRTGCPPLPGGVGDGRAVTERDLWTHLWRGECLLLRPGVVALVGL